jgi:hypothetical protein
VPQFGFKVSDQGHFSGSSITYRCQPGYTLHGATTLKCMTGERRAWDNPLPSCIGGYNALPLPWGSGGVGGRTVEPGRRLASTLSLWRVWTRLDTVHGHHVQMDVFTLSPVESTCCILGNDEKQKQLSYIVVVL